VLAFGSPFGALRFSVTHGIVSAVNRSNPFDTDGRAPGGFIQTDAAINPGNSGGPLVDVYGQLVGINSSIITNSGQFAGAGFAIPSQIARAISADLIEHGKVEHGYLGIAMNDVLPENAHFFNLKDASGAIVAEVTPDSPASRAGLKQCDVITGLNGRKITDSSTLQVAVSEMSPDTVIALDVMRDGKPVTLHVTVGEFNAKSSEVADNDGHVGPRVANSASRLAI
jgi:serine protease Do